MTRCAAIGAIAVLLAACSAGAATGSPSAGASGSARAVPTSGASATAATTPGGTTTAPAPTPGVTPVPTAPPTPGPAGKATCSEPQPRYAGFSALNCTVDAPSLANNKLGDPAKLSAVILLPSTYAGSSKRYPTVYVLAGYTEPADSLDSALAGGLTDAAAKPEMILVLADGMNGLGGSFYVNSPVTGNWEDAIAIDLVGYVDAHYRTLPAAKSRGISGSSMGGAGALTLAMHRPDVFGAVYAMSPGLFDADGAEARLGNEAVVRQVLETQQSVGASAPDPAKVLEASRMGDTDVGFEYAYGLAFAPDPTAPLLMRFPYRLEGGKLVRDAQLWKVWDAGFGGLTEKLQKYGAGLKSLRGIGIDYGTSDSYEWIPKGSAYFVKLLGEAGIAVTANVHDGGHVDRLSERMAQFMLPFMTEKLATS